MRATWRLRSGARPIVLSFPNQSRFYDATRRAVRFWGHDSAMEASFFVNEDALKRIQSDMGFDEVGCAQGLRFEPGTHLRGRSQIVWARSQRFL